MRYREVRKHVKGVPHMTAQQGRTVYDFLLETRSTRVLELGFAHGVSTCIFAAAMEENGGHVTTIDLVSVDHRQPNIWELLNRTGLTERVTVVLEETSYTWALMRFLEATPIYNHHRTHTALRGHPPISRVTNLSGQYRLVVIGGFTESSACATPASSACDTTNPPARWYAHPPHDRVAADAGRRAPCNGSRTSGSYS